MVNLKTSSEQSCKTLSEEITLIKKLDHPNVIKCRAAWVTHGKVVFITDVCTGGSLKSYMKKIRSPRRKVIKNWCKSILEGLNYLHTQSPPVMHHDLKCENIFMDSASGNVKIGDLGLSTALKNTSFEGTPSFMAPELYEERCTPKADIYAFGMCVIEMCTLENPYSECQNSAELFKKVTNHKLPEVLERIDDIEIVEFIKLCLLPENSRPDAETLLHSNFLQNESKTDRDSISLKPRTVLQYKSVQLCMNLKDYLANASTIKFDFFLEKDTPQGIAMEMINELNINKVYLCMLTAQISQILSSKIRSDDATCRNSLRLIEI